MKSILRKICGLAFFIAFAIFSADAAEADGLFFKLPADGSSATYEMIVTPPSGRVDRQLKGSFKISSVGGTDTNGERGRWIEIFQVQRKSTRAIKIHVLEKHLTRDFSVDSIVEAWRKRGPLTPKYIDKPSEIDEETTSELKMFMSSKMNDVQMLDPIDIETPLGKFACTTIKGSVEFGRGQATMVVRSTSHLSRKSPFGVVKSEMTIQAVVDDKVREEYHVSFALTEIDTEAKSAVDHESVEKNPKKGMVIEALPN